MESTLNEVIEYIRNLAPAVWTILIKQVYSDAITNIIVGVFALILTIIFLQSITICVKKMSEHPYDMWEMPITLLSIGIVITVLISLLALVSAFRYIYNPEFYAIQQIIQVTR